MGENHVIKLAETSAARSEKDILFYPELGKFIHLTNHNFGYIFINKQIGSKEAYHGKEEDCNKS